MKRQTERRQCSRRRCFEEHGIVAARIRPGHAALIVDVSARGALVETERRLLPGSAVELQIDRGGERIAVRGRICRCAVSRLSATSVWYRGAIVFDRSIPWFPAGSGNGYSVLPHESRSGTPFRALATPDVL